MDQEKLIDAIQEGILENLPDEAIIKLANLASDDAPHDDEAREILKDYNVNAEQIAQNIVGKENHA